MLFQVTVRIFIIGITSISMLVLTAGPDHDLLGSAKKTFLTKLPSGSIGVMTACFM